MIDIDTMPAGAEIDALIEREVRGIVWDESLCRVCGWPLSTVRGVGCLLGNCSLRPVPKKRADAPAPYSTDRATTLHIADHLHELLYAETETAHYNYLTLVCTGHTTGWAASFDFDLDTEWYEHPSRYPFAARGETLELAVCRASYKAAQSQKAAQ